MQPPPEMVVYCDAAFDAKSKKACIGYITGDMRYTDYKFVIVNNINEAEKLAVEMAMERLKGKRLYTDSMYAVSSFPEGVVNYIARRNNIANIVVRSAMEMSRSKTKHL